MSDSILINDVFISVQGEGPYVGLKQLFIRFSRCNLNCQYCDTDFRNLEKSTKYNIPFLLNEMKELGVDSCHSIVLTGGEPLLETAFLKEFLPQIGDKKIYLETNGILYYNFEEIIDFIDIVSMDYKLSSATGHASKHDIHKRFLHIAKQHNKNIFIKVVFDSNITEEEIQHVCELAEENQVFISLQPIVKDGKISKTIDLLGIMDRFLHYYSNVRLIPQVHTFLGLK